MKITKIILLLTVISLLTSAPYSVANARDCSNPKGFHEKMMCKVSGSSAEAVETKETAAGDGTSSWVKKFLGKKNNEVTGR